MPRLLTSDIIARRIVSNAIKRVLGQEAKEEVRNARRKIKENNALLKKFIKNREKIFKKALNTKLPGDDDIFASEDNSTDNLIISHRAFPKKLIEDMKLSGDKKPVATMTMDDVYRKSMKFDDFSHSENFTHVADILIDRVEKRQTLIEFSPVNNDMWNDSGNWIYIFTINGHIVKIGGTKNGLRQRAASYLCGHHTRKSNVCSITNGIIYNTFLSYLIDGATIKMYGMKCPIVSTTIIAFGETHTVEAQIFDVYESVLIRKYATEHGTPPILSSRSDPRYS